jgi:hypothetical protein
MSVKTLKVPREGESGDHYIVLAARRIALYCIAQLGKRENKGQNSRLPRIDDVPHDSDATAADKQKLKLTPGLPNTTLLDWMSFHTVNVSCQVLRRKGPLLTRWLTIESGLSLGCSRS